MTAFEPPTGPDKPEPGYDFKQHYAVRQRAALEYAVEAGSPVSKGEVLQHVGRVDPPTGPWERTIIGNGSERWVNVFIWSTTGLVKAGLLTKSGNGVWSATDEAKDVLDRFPDPRLFEREIDRRYKVWEESRKQAVQRAWLIRGTSVLGSNLVPEWLAEGFVSVAASQLSELPSDVTADDVKALVQEAYGHLKYQQRKDREDEIVGFVSRMKPDDVVITNNGSELFVGDVTGDWDWVPHGDSKSQLRRRVDWRNLDSPIDFDQLPPPLPARLQTPKTLVDLTEDLSVIDALTDHFPDDAVALADAPMRSSPARHDHLDTPPETLADDLLVGYPWLCEVVELLNERRQVIFYGPPGTGKTFIAQAIADAYAPGREGQSRLVQFHPSYTYEDFFEGFRPASGDTAGTLSFELRPGPLRKLVTQATEHPEQPYFLIIDEINRANLAKVFGELYFLLEYRDKGVELLYSDEADFTLPANVYIIGTMNTADRSIALIDAAMRRRFAFVALHPDEEPTASILPRWLEINSLPGTAAALLKLLNDEIGDRDFKIGPSYFMKEKAQTKASLERVWRSSITPLLEEHHYGSWHVHAKRYDFSRLWASAASTSEGGGKVEAEEPPVVVGDGGIGTTVAAKPTGRLTLWTPTGAVDETYVCTGACGQVLAVTKFPTVAGGRRVGECRTCRDERYAEKAAAKGGALPPPGVIAGGGIVGAD